LHGYLGCIFTGSPAISEELGRLEANVGRLSVPLAYANPLYTLRGHIARDELRQGRQSNSTKTEPGPGNTRGERNLSKGVVVVKLPVANVASLVSAPNEIATGRHSARRIREGQLGISAGTAMLCQEVPDAR
jgi:hypothetical protein